MSKRSKRRRWAERKATGNRHREPGPAADQRQDGQGPTGPSASQAAAASVTGPRSDGRPSHQQPGNENSVTLPEQVGASLQPSEPSSQGSDPVPAEAPSSSGGLGGGRADFEPGYLSQVRKGVRDVRLIRKLLRRPDWVMPDGAEKTLPLELYLIAHDRDRAGKPAGHKVNMRIKAVEVLQAMKRDNDRKLTAGVRLNQIGERTRLMRANPELLLGGNVTNNTTNNYQVVVYLPDKADHSEFALPSEAAAIDVQPANESEKG